MNRQFLTAIDASLGKIKSDLVFKNCKIVDLFRSSVYEGKIAICNGYIAGINDGLEAKETVDLMGAFVSPGFVDSHVHIESSLLPPFEYARIVVPRGSTTVIADPHEITNVLGYDGIKFMIRAASDIPLNIFFMIPSCVPATELDTSGAGLSAADMQQFKNESSVKGLGEVMNFVGALNKEPPLMDKINLFSDMIIDGHAPKLEGKELSAYIMAGIGSDHECTTLAEAEEKLFKSMYIILREGSTTRDLESLLLLVSEKTKHRLLLCTDDIHADDLHEKGHLDFILRKLINNGVDPPALISSAT